LRRRASLDHFPFFVNFSSFLSVLKVAFGVLRRIYFFFSLSLATVEIGTSSRFVMPRYFSFLPFLFKLSLYFHCEVHGFFLGLFFLSLWCKTLRFSLSQLGLPLFLRSVLVRSRKSLALFESFARAKRRPSGFSPPPSLSFLRRNRKGFSSLSRSVYFFGQARFSFRCLMNGLLLGPANGAPG